MVGTVTDTGDYARYLIALQLILALNVGFLQKISRFLQKQFSLLR
jgi:hypothetical protein